MKILIVGHCSNKKARQQMRDQLSGFDMILDSFWDDAYSPILDCFTALGAEKESVFLQSFVEGEVKDASGDTILQDIFPDKMLVFGKEPKHQKLIEEAKKLKVIVVDFRS